jgi:hypothetical protein
MTTYGGRLLLGHEVTSGVNERIRPVTLLVNNTSKLAIISLPFSGGLASKPLNPTEGRILDNHYLTRQHLTSVT